MLALLTLMMLLLVAGTQSIDTSRSLWWELVPRRCTTVIRLLLLRLRPTRSSRTMPIGMTSRFSTNTTVVNTSCCMYTMRSVVGARETIYRLALLLLNRIVTPREFVLDFGWLHIHLLYII